VEPGEASRQFRHEVGGNREYAVVAEARVDALDLGAMRQKFGQIRDAFVYPGTKRGEVGEPHGTRTQRHVDDVLDTQTDGTDIDAARSVVLRANRGHGYS
jgi:hypothetical protein